jgi:hypothetical protein
MMPISIVGSLTLHIHYAERLTDVQTFGKQDPYVVVKTGIQEFKTPVCNDGGRNPKWEVTFSFNLAGGEDMIHFTVKDKEVIKDRNIAGAVIPLRQLITPNGRKSVNLVSCDNSSKNLGILWVSTNFMPVVGAGSGYPGNALQRVAPQQPSVQYTQQPQQFAAAPPPQQYNYAAPPQNYAAPPSQQYNNGAPAYNYTAPPPQQYNNGAPPPYSGTVPKYIFVNGVMKLNPAYGAQTNTQSTVAKPLEALAIVSSTTEIMDVSISNPDKPITLAPSTTSSMEIMQDSYYLQSLGNKVDGGRLLDDITKVFAKYEVPIGLINKLLALTDSELYFILDDSGSMMGTSDVLVKDCSIWMRSKVAAKNGTYPMTRWEECEDRLHILAEILPYVPTKVIYFTFLNNQATFSFTRSANQSPAEYEKSFHEKINQMFQSFSGGGTPLHGKLKQALSSTTSTRRMIYVLTDGQPSDASTTEVANLIKNRTNPNHTPITLLSCSDNNSETDWMKVVEEVSEFCSELDDFISERNEVEHDQGPAFPFSRGFWILCMLVAAINPDDLDALDESKPFTRGTLGNLLGRVLSQQEYQEYWNKHPTARNYNSYFSEFMREDLVSSQIIPKKY